jgi:hypothetical protein
MRRSKRGTPLGNQPPSFQRTLRVAVAVAVIGAAASLALPSDSGALQPRQAGSAFCASRNVKTEAHTNFKVRLVTSRKTVPPGGTVRIRLENRGTVDAAYGYPYQLQRREQNSWINQPVGPFFSARLTVRAGSAGRCQAIHMAKSSLSGLYRVSKSAWPATAKTERPKTVVRATFRVSADKGGRGG